jgi:hypothetical protein
MDIYTDDSRTEHGWAGSLRQTTAVIHLHQPIDCLEQSLNSDWRAAAESVYRIDATSDRCAATATNRLTSKSKIYCKISATPSLFRLQTNILMCPNCCDSAEDIKLWLNTWFFHKLYNYQIGFCCDMLHSFSLHRIKTLGFGNTIRWKNPLSWLHVHDWTWVKCWNRLIRRPT